MPVAGWGTARAGNSGPPRGLQGWQQLPVSAIANFQPVVLRDPGAASLQAVLKAHPYERFPVTQRPTMPRVGEIGPFAPNDIEPPEQKDCWLLEPPPN